MLDFQTDFEELVWFAPNMQSVSITIYDTLLQQNNLEAYLEVRACDTNKQPLNNIQLNENTFLDQLPQSAFYLRRRGVLANGIFHICYVPFHQIDKRMKYLRVRLCNDSNPSEFFAEKFVHIKQACNDNSEISLYWVNQKAGWDYYTFQTNFEIRQDVTGSTNLTEFAARNERVVNRTAEITMRLSSGIVPPQSVEGVKSLLTSRCAFINDTNGVWFKYRQVQNDTIIPIYVKPASIIIQEAKGGGATFDFEVILKKTNV